MFDFGKKKREEEEAAEKAKQEQVGQAMKSMSDQIAGQAQTIKKLEEQLAAAKSDDAKDDAAARALAQAQAQLRQMRAEMEKMKAAQVAAEAAEKAAGKAAAGAAEAGGGAIGGAMRAPAGGSAKQEAPGVLGGSPEATPAPTPPATGGLAVGGTAYVRKAGGKNLRLRDAVGLNSNAFAGLAPGTSMTLLAGPVERDGYPWWHIRASDGREGWVAGTELVTNPE